MADELLLTPKEIDRAAFSVYEGLDDEKGYIRARPADYVGAGAKAQLAKAKLIILKGLLNKPDLLTSKGRDVIIRLVKEMED